MRYTRALPLAVLLGFLVPLYGAYLHPDLLARQFWLFVWQLYPMWVAGALFLFSRVFADTVEQDKIDAPKRDLPHVRFAVGISVLISAGAWVAATLLGPYSLKGLFLPATIPKNTTNLNDAAVQFLRIDELAIFGSALLWLGYLFGDMKRAGMDVGWLRLLLYGPASVLTVGPGATLGMGWLWREDILANRWHKDACKGENLERLGETVSKANGRLRGGK
jgi:hypothetical protein